MRRKEKEINDKSAIETIIKRSLACRLGLAEKDKPYVVPLCFGYNNNTLYFHSAPEGKKINIIKNNPNVCFEFDVDVDLVKNKKACSWGMRYRSVIGFGKASFIEDPAEKREALRAIVSQYSKDQVVEYTEADVKGIVLIKVKIDRMTGKTSGIKI